ncbi:glutathione S-transferase T3-like [Lotus japonicus]|uniref:glutathione S-transferase T3-like n=1 Tax=Lotus japonicus TaxID=34305 RepID=UPI002585DFB8|nr:glutathione S-transferase T3-like [Lotus japonicus]
MDPSFQAYFEYLKNQSSSTLENSSNSQTSMYQTPPYQVSQQPPSNQVSQQPPPYQVSQQPPPYQVSQQPPPNQVSQQPPIFYQNQPHYAGNNSPNPQYVVYQQQPFIYQPHAGDGSQNPTHFVHPSPPPPNSYSPQISSSSEKVPETQFEGMPDELDETTFPAKGDGQKTKQQRLKWCENDDIILLQTWLNISKDSVTGTDQKAEAFWRRVEHQYNKYRKVGSPERKWSQLKSRYHTLSKAVSIFVGCYKKVTNPPKSGYSERDIMADACSLYNAMEKTKTFNFEHAWRVLKDEPK